jgi:hypothetical protein
LGTRERAEDEQGSGLTIQKLCDTKCRSGRVPKESQGRGSAVFSSEINRGKGISAI